MTVQEVLSRVAVVQQHADQNDYEAAHSAEDVLHTDVLEAIATGEHTSRACDLASAALKTKSITFERHCA